MNGLVIHSGGERLGRQDLRELPVPESTDTHTVVPHHQVVAATLEALEYRRIKVVKEDYGTSKDHMNFFGVLTLDLAEESDRADRISLTLGLRNSHSKTFSLGMVAGFRVFICDNLAYSGDFFAVSRKHSKGLMKDFTDVIALGVDKVQRRFAPMQRQVDVWRDHELADVRAKEIIFDAFVRDRVEMPKHLMKAVDDEYFNPKHPEFEPRTMWALHNGFTSAIKRLDDVPMQKALTSVGEYFSALQ